MPDTATANAPVKDERTNMVISMPKSFRDALVKFCEDKKISVASFAREQLANAAGLPVPVSVSTRVSKYNTPEEREAARKAAAKARQELVKQLMKEHREKMAAQAAANAGSTGGSDQPTSEQAA